MRIAGYRSGYDEAVEHLDAFGSALIGLIRELLRDSGLGVHSIDYRVKTHTSAARKINRNDERYGEYQDLHDLLGVRIITYFEDEVDKIAHVLVPEFEVDQENSVDKRATLDPDRFGYMSLHYVAKLSAKRSRLIEYKRFTGRAFELQIRSILQHAWAEIEHDLGYKTEGAIPRDVRRRFSRLSGLLELADDEFRRLRIELAEYEQVVEERIESNPKSLGIDQSTIDAFLRSGAVDALSAEIAALFPGPLVDEVDRRVASRFARELQIFGVSDMRHVQQLVDGWHRHALKFAEIWLGDRKGKIEKESLGRGIGLFYLTYCLAGNASPEQKAAWSGPRRRFVDGETLTERIDKTWSEVVAELGPPPVVV